VIACPSTVASGCVLFGGGGVPLGTADTETEACPMDKIGNNKDANRAVWSFILYSSFVRELSDYPTAIRRSQTFSFCKRAGSEGLRFF